jgi:hypothetical protein
MGHVRRAQRNRHRDRQGTPFKEPDKRSDLKAEETIELFVTCETTFPLLSIRWSDRDNVKAAEPVLF